MAESINAAILERLEKVVSTLQENSVKMGQLLAVHNEKLDKQDRIDAVLFEKVESVHREVNRQSREIKDGCERDIRKVDERLRLMEKKMWSIFGALSIISFAVSPVGQRVLKNMLTPNQNPTIMAVSSLPADAIFRPAVRKSPVS
tara:strand:+ start:150 stop:584 length:435 start_codon:yes stop_codon:yes gene_type:complete